MLSLMIWNVGSHREKKFHVSKSILRNSTAKEGKGKKSWDLRRNSWHFLKGKIPFNYFYFLLYVFLDIQDIRILMQRERREVILYDMLR